jgi:hypothetical protein
LNGDIRMLAQAWLAVDGSGGPFNGNIYVTWASDPPDPLDNSDIFLSRYADGGKTWSEEVQIAAGSVTDQFEPFVAVGADATNFYYAWGDNRNTVISAAYPKGRPDPDVFFGRRPAPLVAGTCVGECDASRTVTVDEVLTMVNITLGNVAVSRCDAGDASRDGQMTVDEILAAVNNALNECGGNRPDRSFAGIPAP